MVNPVSLPFAEQIDFFREKINLPTTAWTDLWGNEHDFAFVVAGANRDALMADFRTAVDRVIADGGTLEEFRKDFDAIVARNGWSYNGGRNWRSQVIYDTNLRTSYAAGRYEQLRAVVADRPYWRYVHSDAVEDPREEHLDWDGTILSADDPWWDEHFPPNGWGCQCSVESVSEEELADAGKSGPDQAPPVNRELVTVGQNSPNGPRTVSVPNGIDPGFAHIPGRARLEGLTPAEIAGRPPLRPAGVPDSAARSPLPDPRASGASPLPADATPQAAGRAFLGAFGASDAATVFTDVIGERLVIGPAMLRGDRAGILRDSRAPYTPLLAETIRDPDEIWTRIEHDAATGSAQVARRYIARRTLAGVDAPLLLIWERRGAGWWARIEPEPADPASARMGVRLYRRPD